MGYCPDWYPVIRAARYLKVAPWILVEQPLAWRNWALSAESAENNAHKQKEAAAARKNKKKR